MELTLATILVAFAGVFLICFMKGAFGGGFYIVGIPLLSAVMDPVMAGGLLAPLFVAMDLFALRYWKPSTWSKPDLVLLLPGLVIGIALGHKGEIRAPGHDRKASQKPESRPDGTMRVDS